MTLKHISSQGVETTEIVYDRKVPFILPSVTDGEPTAEWFR
jgi:hypothetical protein